jgi:CBS domain containing-hemolysin-like protein
VDAFSWVGVTLIAVALALVAVVAAAEAGLITLSRARVRLLAGQGVPRASDLHGYLQERDSLLQALALGRNLAIVVAAAMGAAVVTRERGDDWLVLAVAVVGALTLVFVLEAIPRLIVRRSPERWGLRLSPIIGVFRLLFGVPARLLALPARAVAYGSRRLEGEGDDLMRLLELEEDESPIEEDERKMIRGVFNLEDTTVREIMTPRTDIAALEADATPQEAARVIVEKGYSRIPIFDGSLDSIAGIVYAKDLMRYFAEGTAPGSLREIARRPLFVPESKHLDDLLNDMRRQRVHMAIVVDEYGGTAGLVTIEDMLEEIVGEIEDEYDRTEQQIIRLSDREAILDGRVAIDELNEMFDVDIEREDFDTVGGCLFHLLGKMPSVGDEVETAGISLRVLAVDRHRIKRVRALRLEKAEAEPDSSSTGSGRSNGKGNGNGRKENGYA